MRPATYPALLPAITKLRKPSAAVLQGQRNRPRSPGFDTWLQRGRLAAKYREAQQFMTVLVTLRKQLPQGVVATTFANRGLIQQGARNVVRYPYVGDTLIEEDDDEHIPNWKARFSVSTHLGDWVSEECFENLTAPPCTPNSAPRNKARLAELLENEPDSQWKIQCRDSLSRRNTGRVG